MIAHPSDLAHGKILGSVLVLNFHCIGIPHRKLADGEEDVRLDRAQFLEILEAIAGRSDVHLTFDDGNSSDVSEALPELMRRGWGAEFFVCPARLEPLGLSRRMSFASCTWLECRLVRTGWITCGGGGSAASIEREIVQAKQVLEDALQAPVETAACPFGEYDRRTLSALRAEGSTACIRVTADGRARRIGSSLGTRCTAATRGMVQRMLNGSDESAVAGQQGQALGEAKALTRQLDRRKGTLPAGVAVAARCLRLPAPSCGLSHGTEWWSCRCRSAMASTPETFRRSRCSRSRSPSLMGRLGGPRHSRAGWWGGARAASAALLGALLLIGLIDPTSAPRLVPAGGGTFDGTTQHDDGRRSEPVGRWSHLALTYDGKTLRLYEDGTPISSRAISGTILRTKDPLWIGGNRPYGEHFEGLIDDVRVYDRALSASEVRAAMSTPVAPGRTSPGSGPCRGVRLRRGSGNRGRRRFRQRQHCSDPRGQLATGTVPSGGALRR